MKEYRIAKGWAIFIYIGAALLMVLFGWILIMPFVLEDIPIESSYILAPISLIMIGFMLVGFLDTIKGKVLVTEDTLSIRSTFINRDLKFDEIKGYRVDDKYIYVIPNRSSKKRIKISTYIGRVELFVTWLSNNFDDLNLIHKLKEEKKILEDFEYGRNEVERASKLRQAKITAKILNWGGGLVAAWTIFFVEPYYEYAIICSIMIPILSIIIATYFKGLVRIEEKKNSPYPTVFFGILMSSCALAIRATLDFNIYEYSNTWLPTFSIALGLVVLLVITTKELKFKKAKDYFSAFFLFMFLSGYGYGVVVIANCYYDKSVPVHCKTKILDKVKGSKKMITYYFELAPWDKQIKPDDVTVAKGFYERMKVGDSVNVYLKEGVYDIPWVIIAE